MQTDELIEEKRTPDLSLGRIKRTAQASLERRFHVSGKALARESGAQMAVEIAGVALRPFNFRRGTAEEGGTGAEESRAERGEERFYHARETIRSRARESSEDW